LGFGLNPFFSPEPEIALNILQASTVLPNKCVRVLRPKVADLYGFEGKTPVSNPEPDAKLAIKQFSSCPKLARQIRSGR